MAFRTLYKTFFQIELLHSYFLDDGSSSFSGMSDEDKKIQLQKYDFSDFLEVVPSYPTQLALRNHKLMVRKGTDGFRIMGNVIEETDRYKSSIFLTGGQKLTFLIYAKDYLFDNYTELTREKDRLYYFSNIKPDTETIPYSYIPLNTASDLVAEDFLLTAESSRQLWYDLEQDSIRADIKARLDIIADLEVSDINSDEGIQIIGQSIQQEKSKGLVGIIQLQMLGDNSMDIIEIDDTDPDDVKSYFLDPTPKYRLHFDNRKTIWKYIKKSDDNELETIDTKPLTRNGFIEIDPDTDLVAPLPDNIGKYSFPNPTAAIIKSITDENTSITKTYSEIYI